MTVCVTAVACLAALMHAFCLIAWIMPPLPLFRLYYSHAAAIAAPRHTRTGRYSEFMLRYDKLAEEIQRIEQELEADNEGQVVMVVMVL